MSGSFQVGPEGREATIFLDKQYVDSETIKQVATMAAHSSVHHARVMPDCHKGNGCCIGFTSHLTTAIVPGIVGGDIGCGIAVHELPVTILDKKNADKKIDTVIKAHIPIGNGPVHKEPIVAPEQYAYFYLSAQTTAVSFTTAYRQKFGIDIAPYMPAYNEEWCHQLAERVGSDYKYDLLAMGTLGGGNHFISVDQSVDGKIYLTVHTGSRNLGMKIAQYHSGLMYSGTAHDDEDTGCDPAHTGLTGEAAARYYFDMIWAQTWATMNRRAIISTILYQLGITFEPSKMVETVHNYIDFHDMIIRKGAIRAAKDQIAVVALNMRDGILLCRGRGNEEWNCSGPHGCGRIVGRRSATTATSKRDITYAMKKYEQEMGDVYSTSVCPETLDERPSVYRDMKIICNAIGPTLDIIAHASTKINVKGC